MHRETADFRKILLEEFSEKNRKNSNYSMRAFARDLGLSSGRLSDILNRKQGLSQKTAQRVASKLGYNSIESEFFCTLVSSQCSRNAEVRKRANQKLSSIKTSKQNLIQTDVFNTIADWWHFAILELSELPNFVDSADWVAKKLQISKIDAGMALERLKRLGLLKEINSKLVASQSQSFAEAGVPSRAVKKFHEQILNLAQHALSHQTLDEREFVATLLTVNADRVREAKTAMAEFRKKFSAQFHHEEKNKNQVYCMSMQFFRIGEKDNV